MSRCIILGNGAWDRKKGAGDTIKRANPNQPTAHNLPFKHRLPLLPLLPEGSRPNVSRQGGMGLDKVRITRPALTSTAVWSIWEYGVHTAPFVPGFRTVPYIVPGRVGIIGIEEKGPSSSATCRIKQSCARPPFQARTRYMILYVLDIRDQSSHRSPNGMSSIILITVALCTVCISRHYSRTEVSHEIRYQ